MSKLKKQVCGVWDTSIYSALQELLIAIKKENLLAIS